MPRLVDGSSWSSFGVEEEGFMRSYNEEEATGYPFISIGGRMSARAGDAGPKFVVLHHVLTRIRVVLMRIFPVHT